VDSVIVIGGGVVGAAVLEAIARRDAVSAVLYEQAHAWAAGATGSSGGLVRVYHTQPVLTELAAASVPMLRDFRRRTGLDIGYRTVGSLYFEPESRVEAARNAVDELSRKTDWSLEVLLPDEGERRFPSFNWRSVGAAVFEPDAGYADPTKLTDALVSLARSSGALAHTGTRVEEVVIEAGRVKGVRIGVRHLPADTVVLAAGAWSSHLAGGLDPPLPLRSKQIQYSFFRSSTGAGDHPAFIDDTTHLYGRPDTAGRSLVGITLDDWDVPLELATPDSTIVGAVRSVGRERIPWIETAAEEGGVRAFDGYAPGGLPHLGPSPEVEGLLFATGWSGGGFKMALGAAERIAEHVDAITS